MPYTPLNEIYKTLELHRNEVPHLKPLPSGSDVKNSTLRAFALVPVLVAANHQLSIGGT